MISAEFFDIFGFIGFVVLLFCGIKVFNSKDKTIKKYGLIIAVIALLGMLIDGYIVIKTYILGS